MEFQSQLFKKEMLTRNSLQEQIRLRIEEMITSGQLQVGDGLPSEIEMARQFDVHRSTIREALRVLAQRGLIEMKVGSGSYVSRVSPSVVAETIDTYSVSNESSYEDIAILRTLLEPGIAALAALRAEPEDLQRLEEALNKMEVAINSEDLDSQISVDAEFHLALTAASRNDLLFAIFSGIQYVLQRALKTGYSRPGKLRRDPVEVLNNHRALFAAVKAGDPVRAIEQMKLQIRSLSEDGEIPEDVLNHLLNH
jgi:GntR family transcriptional regulator, transcriptional repressor for pyruvate dehydrogenase complex